MSLVRVVRSRLASESAGVAERLFRRAVLARAHEPAGPQVFILGLPRSGTTLVYQYLVHRLHVAYFTQAVGHHPCDPCRTTWSQIRSGGTYRSDFESEYGRSRGDLAPREAGSFWLRFFHIDDYQTNADVREEDLAEMRKTVACIQALFHGAPFVNKNVKHLLRVPVLNGAFPNPHFLVVERDPVDVALSVWRSRLEYSGSYDAWFSVRPSNYEALRALDPVEQVVGQIVGLERKLNEDLAWVDAARVHRIDYASFCRRPDDVLPACGGVFAQVTEKNPPVPTFERRSRGPQDEVEARLAARIREEYGS